MSQIENPLSVRSILHMNLNIPNYQRPYKWKVKNVINLITDIEHERQSHNGNPTDDYKYRIGSIILHNDNDNINIVDGQQRLLTICLILSLLAEANIIDNISLLKVSFTNTITLDNLKYNRNHIEKYFKNWETNEKKEFVEFLLDKCEMIIINASNISEAFQLFDSQNARGKTLEPADLLKAYHLRAMFDEHEKRMCVQRWEDAIDKKILHYVLSEIIYRCRRWMRHDYESYEFSKESLEEFKGIDINIFKFSGKIFPYMQKLYVVSQISAYNLDEPIVNGKRFFDYVDHYVSMYEMLFPAINDNHTKKNNNKFDQDNDYQDMIRSNCFYSPKMHRTGDSRLRNALYCLLISYYDKFGDNEYKEFFKIAFQYVYQYRLLLSQIGISSILIRVLQGKTSWSSKSENQTNPFDWICNSYNAYPSELRNLLTMPQDEITPLKLNNKVRE